MTVPPAPRTPLPVMEPGTAPAGHGPPADNGGGRGCGGCRGVTGRGGGAARPTREQHESCRQAQPFGCALRVDDRQGLALPTA